VSTLLGVLIVPTRLYRLFPSFYRVPGQAPNRGNMPALRLRRTLSQKLSGKTPCCLGRWPPACFSENDIPGFVGYVHGYVQHEQQHVLPHISFCFSKWLSTPNHYAREFCIEILCRAPISKSKYLLSESRAH